MDVGTIVARDVATAICIDNIGSILKKGANQNSTGTMTIPPPTPNSPAKTPAAAPVNNNSTTVSARN